MLSDFRFVMSSMGLLARGKSVLVDAEVGNRSRNTSYLRGLICIVMSVLDLIRRGDGGPGENWYTTRTVSDL